MSTVASPAKQVPDYAIPPTPGVEDHGPRSQDRRKDKRRAGVKQGKPDAYSRKAVPSAAGQEAARRKEYFAQMRAHFAEVSLTNLSHSPVCHNT